LVSQKLVAIIKDRTGQDLVVKKGDLDKKISEFWAKTVKIEKWTTKSG